MSRGIAILSKHLQQQKSNKEERLFTPAGKAEGQEGQDRYLWLHLRTTGTPAQCRFLFVRPQQQQRQPFEWDKVPPGLPPICRVFRCASRISTSKQNNFPAWSVVLSQTGCSISVIDYFLHNILQPMARARLAVCVCLNCVLLTTLRPCDFARPPPVRPTPASHSFQLSSKQKGRKSEEGVTSDHLYKVNNIALFHGSINM